MRLNESTLERGEGAGRYCYDRNAGKSGIVHFGIGAFHRAHQAWYTDRAMNAGDTDWMITGVSLRSASVAEQMNPQDGLYTIAERARSGSKLTIVGAVREVLTASRDPQAITATLASPDTRIASFTVTEKGYCRAADGSLDRDLAGAGSIFGFLGAGLAARRSAGLAGITLLSCDNLSDNGRQLGRLMGEWCDDNDPELGRWIADHCTFPATMVDRIVPATTDRDREWIEAATGVQDMAAVVTEPFSQWVIEDRFAGARPAWDSVGAELVSDIAPYEMAKLRMLNGAHSLLAYCGLARGHTYVHEAVADPELRGLADRLMRQEAAPTVEAAPGQDLDLYADALLDRFANPALNHRLIQIAADGSQKIPQRWLETRAAQRARGCPTPAIDAGLAGWFRHLRGANGIVDDPMAEQLGPIARECDDEALRDILFGPGGMLRPC